MFTQVVGVQIQVLLPALYPLSHPLLLQPPWHSGRVVHPRPTLPSVAVLQRDQSSCVLCVCMPSGMLALSSCPQLEEGPPAQGVRCAVPTPPGLHCPAPAALLWWLCVLAVCSSWVGCCPATFRVSPTRHHMHGQVRTICLVNAGFATL